MTLDGTLAFLSAYWPEIVSIVALVLMSAFFSGSETALTAVSRSRIHTLEANGEQRAGIVRQLIERRDRLIGALLIGNNLANILSSSLATSLFLGVFGNSGVALAYSTTYGTGAAWLQPITRMTPRFLMVSAETAF